MKYVLVTLLLFGGMMLYTRIANKYLIFDNPNIRSSHSKPTIRGGGVVFLLSILFAGILHHPTYWLPISGAFAIGVISFLDDNIEVSQSIRFLVHLFAITTIFVFLSIFSAVPIWQTLVLYILVAGIINAYNFMDGINGITGLYSFVVLGSLQYVNIYQLNFIEPDLIWLPILACGVFSFYNFRKKAKVFAGDVGSITIAFWIVFLISYLIRQTGNWNYLLFLTVYGVDTVLTIVHRLILKQNVFEAHRFHFYQILANEQKISHLLVASLYAFLQLLIIVFVLSSHFGFLELFLISALPLAAFYMVMKPRLLKQAHTSNEVNSEKEMKENQAIT